MRFETNDYVTFDSESSPCAFCIAQVVDDSFSDPMVKVIKAEGRPDLEGQVFYVPKTKCRLTTFDDIGRFGYSWFPEVEE